MFKSIGRNSIIYTTSKIINRENVSIGIESVIDDFTFLYATGKGIDIGNFCHIIVHSTLMAGGKITIKDFTTIGPNCTILAETDDYVNAGFVGLKVLDKYRTLIEKDVTLEKHIHIGAGTTVLPGVTIGEGCSVGAGSLVTKDLPEWTICYGSPCRVMKSRLFAKEDQLKMEQEFLKEYYKNNV